MPIEPAQPASTALFLFAHQDDEFGVFEKIIQERNKGRRVSCAYLTDGAFGGAAPERRNAESRTVLMQLGVRKEDIFFAGGLLAIPDAGLSQRLTAAAEWIGGWFGDFREIGAIYVPAWEGGHHDHDALHAVAVCIAARTGLLNRMRQFPLYTGYGCRPPWFKVLLPLAGNGAVEETTIPWLRRLQFMRHCLRYRSQAKTWLGLLPFVALHYCRAGTQAVQPVAEQNIMQPPHKGVLYYEGRGFYTWSRLSADISAWRQAQ
jgi:LmbE family N-acetylglucosaminyl deacetylase